MRVSLLKFVGIGLERVVRMIFTPINISENLIILEKLSLQEMMAGFTIPKMGEQPG